MISAIIIVGISLKLAIILVLIRTSIGFSAMYQRLKHTFTLSQEETEVNYLASGLIQEYEARSVPLTSESVEETTLLEESDKATLSPSKVQSFFALMKHESDSKPSKACQRKPRKTLAPEPELLQEASHCSGIPQRRQSDWQVCSPVDVVSKSLPSDDKPTAPVSVRPVMDGWFQQNSQGLPADCSATLPANQSAPQLAPITSHIKPAKGRLRIRSKLAVKLEKKLDSLDYRVSRASACPRQEVLLQKLDKLIRNHAKKLAQTGRTELPVIFEDELVLSN
jgi:hypothetical protein